MGRLLDGQWSDEWYDTSKTEGRFVRQESQFRHRVCAHGTTGFAPDTGRYHLYVSYACPWAHRTLIYRALKGLESAISVSTVDPYMGSEGWTFNDSTGQDPIMGARVLWEVYVAAAADYTGRVTVPILWDRVTQTIVNNESSEIIRMMNSEFDSIAASPTLDLSPTSLASEIASWNELIYPTLNNGVYRAGFATTQSAYEEAVQQVFASLEVIESRLERERFLCGDQLTEADIRLFPTLYRFDAVYHGHFKCNVRRLTDYPNLWAYARDIYQQPGVADTCDMGHVKAHYYRSHPTINPSGVVPIGPALDWNMPYGREGARS
jgi:glutathionyl-hydroquinone reductase